MFLYLFLIFIVTPLMELYILIEVGSAIGALTIILIIIATAALGGILMKYQGVQLIKQTQREMAQGHMPKQAALEGVLIFIGGISLFLPGLVTDLIGLLLLLPPVRAQVAHFWLIRGAKRFNSQQYHYTVDAEWQSRDPVSGRVHYQRVHHEGPISEQDEAQDVTRGARVIEGEWRDDDSKKHQ
jgi:UPF0716 protein FxsA